MKTIWGTELESIDPFSDLVLYQTGSVKTNAGISLQGDWKIGIWSPNRKDHYIHGMPDAEDLLSYASYAEANDVLTQIRTQPELLTQFYQEQHPEYSDLSAV